MSQQQTVLRVQFDNVNSITGITEYEFLDLYSDVPIKINKSFAELQDISKRNSDYSIGLQLPGSKKNNKFFENFFNVDTQSLYFDATKRVPCNVLLDDVSYFSGYMRLNKTSVLDSKVEYSVTLYSTIGDLFGNIGNGLLNELNFDDDDYTFNHTFDQYAVTNDFNRTIFSIDDTNPTPYFYPIVHNGYSYTANTSNQLVVDLSGNTATSPITRLYTSTGPINNYPSQAAAFADGVQKYRINTPNQGLIDNQLKPALNIYSLIQLIFKKYGYTIKSDFFNTPWFKASYMYGYFSSDETKFSYQIPQIQTLPLEGVSIVFVSVGYIDYCYVTKLGTGIPCFCSSNIDVVFQYDDYPYDIIDYPLTIIAGTTGVTSTYGGTFLGGYSSQVSNGTSLSYLPQPANTTIPFTDGMSVDFSKVINKDLKQIDLLSSIAKKFNLVFVPDPEVQNQIIIEPYNYYIGTGDIHDWSDKISYDKGFSVEPALNYIESELFLSDLEDGDYGNQTFKNSNGRLYGENIVYNPTDFKSQQKKIDTIFSPELIRTWDNNISLPLGINYVGTTETVKSNGNEIIQYVYKGVRTKPKLMFWLGGFNPFLNTLGEAYSYSGSTNYATYNVYISDSDGNVNGQFQYIPIISHTMPIGNTDDNKGPLRGFNNDSICNLFNSEQPIRIGTTETYNVYTENDIYSLFYSNRIDNLYNPNTRFLKGQFNLKYNDVKNLKPNDLIKINEQYFTWNKIDGFNLTNRELTQVELIQTNNNPSEYPTRYFSYFYCDNPGTCFKLKTDFTNPNLRDTNYFWSILYDYNIGILGGSATGFTSSFLDFQNNTGKYVAYYMTEITENDYDTSSCQYFTCDTLLSYIYDETQFSPFNTYIPGFWFSSGINDLPYAANTKQGLNVFSGCTEFQTAVTTYGITTGTSIYHGVGCPTPTPTATVTATPTVTPTNPPTPSITPTNTITPTITPTNTITPTKTVTPTVTPTNGSYPGNLLFTKFDGRPNDINIQTDDSVLVAFAITTSFDGAVHYDTSGNVLKALSRGGTYDLYCPITDSAFTIEKYSESQYIIGDGTQWSNITGNYRNYPGFTTLVNSSNFANSTAGFTLTNSCIKIRNSNNALGFIAIRSSSTNTLYSSNYGYKSSMGTGYDFDFQSTGKLIVATSNGVIRINTDFTLDATFTNYSGSTQGVAVDYDNKIYIVGTGVTNKIVRLNSNGTVDTSFITGTGFNTIAGYLFKVAVTKDNTPIIIGPFDTYSGVTKNCIVKLNDNGSINNTFDTGTGFNNTPTTIDIDSLNNVWIGGHFTTYKSISCGNIVKLYGGIPLPTPTPTITPTSTVTPGLSPSPTPTQSTGMNSIIQSGLTINVNGTYPSYPGTGTTWYDLQNNYNGTLINGPTFTSATGGYFTFDGINDEASFTSSNNISTTEYTFGGWCNFPRSGFNEGICTRVTSFDASLALYKDTSQKIVCYNNYFGDVRSVTSSQTLSINTWYYVIATYKQSTSNGLKIYINGVLDATLSGSTTLLSDNQPWKIAVEQTNIRTGDFELYNRVLSDAEITTNFNTRKGIYGY